MAVSKSLLEDYTGWESSHQFVGTKSAIIAGLNATSIGSAAETAFILVFSSLGALMEGPQFSSTLDTPIPTGSRVRGLSLQGKIFGENQNGSNPNVDRTLGMAVEFDHTERINAVPLTSATHHNPRLITPINEITSWTGYTLQDIYWILHGSSGPTRKLKAYDLALLVEHYAPPVISNLTGERVLSMAPNVVEFTWDWDPGDGNPNAVINRSGFREVYVFALEDAPDPNNMPPLSLAVVSGQGSHVDLSPQDSIAVESANIRNYRDYRVYARSARGDWPYDPPFYSNWTSAVVSFESNGVVRPVVISVEPILDRKYNRTEVNLVDLHISDYDPEYYYVLRDGKRITGNIPIMDKFFHDVGITPGIPHTYSAIAGAKSELDNDEYVESAESDAVTAAPVVYDRWLLRNTEHQQLTNPAESADFSRNSTAYLDGVEHPAGEPRYPYGVNLLTRDGSTVETASDWGGTSSGSALVDVGLEGRRAIELGHSAGATNYRYLNTAVFQSILARVDFTRDLIVSFRIRSTDGTKPNPGNGTPNFRFNVLGARTPTISDSPDSEGWYRCSLYRTGTSEGQLAFGPLMYSVTSSTPKYQFVDFQLEYADGDTPSPWRPGGPSAVLIEEGTTNLLTEPQSLLLAIGLSAFRTQWEDSAESYKGFSARKLMDDDTDDLNTHHSRTGQQVGIQTRTTTVLAKRGEKRFFGLCGLGATAQSIPSGAIFDLQEGVVTAYSQDVEPVIENVGDGWFRCGVTAPEFGFTLQLFLSNGPNLADARYDGSVSEGEGVHVILAQHEAKPYATSWHPGGSTRVKDDAGIPVSAVSPVEGTIEVELDYRHLPHDAYFVDARNNSNEYIVLYRISGAFRIEVRNNINGTRNVLLTAGQVAALHGQRVRLVGRWSSSGISLLVNGVLVGTNSGAAVRFPPSLSSVAFGSRWSHNLGHINMNVLGVRISSRARSDAELADWQAPLTEDKDTTWLMNFEESLDNEAYPLAASAYDLNNIELEVDGDSSLDMESGDDRADFNPLGRRGYISISDTLRGYKFPVDIQLMGYEAYKQFQKMRESRALMLLQAPMTGRKWYFRLGKVREKIQNTASDYYKLSFDVAENDEPRILGLTDTFTDNPHGS